MTAQPTTTTPYGPVVSASSSETVTLEHQPLPSCSVFVQLQEQNSFDSAPSIVQDISPEVEDGANDDLHETTAWEFFISGFLPVMLHLVTAAVTLLYSLICSHGVRMLAALTSPILDWVGKTCGDAWLAVQDNKALADWPPIHPVVSVLFLVTIVTLLVNPDGLHWIILQKLRSGMVSLLQAPSSCWGLVVNDYGAIVSSMLALATFASLFLLAYILHKTLTPRTTEKAQRPAEKKRKKRKGHHNARGNRGGGASRIKGVQQKQHPSECVSEQETREASNVKDRWVVDESQRDDATLPLPALVEDKPLNPPVSMSSPERLVAKSFREEAGSSRIRAASASTVDTTTLSDDQSCGTVSGRSTPTSLPRALSSEQSSIPMGAAINVGKVLDDKNTQTWATSAQKSSTRRSKKPTGTKEETVARSKVPSSRAGPSSSSSASGSRWDALRPSNRVSSTRRVNPKAQVVREHVAETRSNRKSPALGPIGKPTLESPTLVPMEPIGRLTSTVDLATPASAPTPVFSTVADDLRSCEDGASKWSGQQADPAVSVHSSYILQSPPRPCPTTQSDSTFFSSPLHTSRDSCWSQTNGTATGAGTGTAKPSSLRAPPGLTLSDDACGVQPLFSKPSAEVPFLLSTCQSLSLQSSLSPPRFGSGHVPVAPSPVRENPFASDDYGDVNGNTADDKIEAELQELGGQMVGSILDF